MKTRQTGFAVLEALLILVVITVVSGIGWYAIHTKHQTDKILSQADKISQSATTNQVTAGTKEKLVGGKVDFTLPKGWSSSTANDSDCVWSLIDANPPKCLAYTGLAPSSLQNDPNNRFIVYFSVFSQGNGSSDPKLWLLTGPSNTDKNDISENLRVNGQSAYHFEQNNTVSEPYTDERYIIISNQTVVDIYTRVKHQNENSGINDDFTKYLPEIRSIVNSVKIN